jgi:hypothetical protein
VLLSSLCVRARAFMWGRAWTTECALECVRACECVSSENWTLKMGQTHGPETLVKNQRKATLSNKPIVTT